MSNEKICQGSKNLIFLPAYESAYINICTSSSGDILTFSNDSFAIAVTTFLQLL